MTAQDDPYVRVYYRIVDDPKFASIYDDDQALATWLRLLLHADAMHPAPATLPQGTRKSALDKLVAAGLVEQGTGHRYRIHGLNAERGKRAEAARFAADVKNHGREEALRRQSVRSAAAHLEQSMSSAERVPLRTEPLQSSPNRASPTLPREKIGSRNETDEERLARYVALRDNPSTSADIRYAADKEVERLHAIRHN
jgi:hypothetical protein